MSRTEHSLFKKFGILTVVEIISKVSLLISLPLVTRLFGPTNYGVYSQANILAAFITPIILLGVDGALLRMLSSLPDRSTKYRFIKNAFVIVLGTALLSLILILMANYWLQILLFGDASGIHLTFVIYGFTYALVSGLLNCVKIIIRANDNIKDYGLLMTAISIIKPGIIGACYYCDVDASLVIFLMLIPEIGAILYLTVIWRRKISDIHSWIDSDISRRLLRYGMPLLPMAYAIWAINSCDRLIMVKYLTIEEIGRYSFNYSVTSLGVQLLLSPLFFSFPTKAAQLFDGPNRKILFHLLYKSMRWSCIIIGGFIPVILISYDWGIGLFFGSGYKVDLRCIILIYLAYMISYLASYLDVMLSLIYKQAFSTIAIVLALVANILLNLLLIPYWGIIGAAAATMTAFLIQLIALACFCYIFRSFFKTIGRLTQ